MYILSRKITAFANALMLGTCPVLSMRLQEFEDKSNLNKSLKYLYR